MIDCYDPLCTYRKPHAHVHTPNGSYVKYIIEPCKHGVKGFCDKCVGSSNQVTDGDY